LEGYAADDWVGLHFVGSKLHHVVSPKPNANAYEVSRNSAEGSGTMAISAGPIQLCDSGGAYCGFVEAVFANRVTSVEFALTAKQPDAPLAAGSFT